MEKKSIPAVIVGIILIFAAIFSIMAYQQKNPKTIIMSLADDTNATANSLISLVESLNDFTFDFYDEIKSDEEGNIFFSPYSIFTALSMAYEGADGNTATEMQSVLNVLQNDSTTLGTFGKLYNLLNQNQDGYEINTANAFWASDDYTFLTDYTDILKNFYMAEAYELDFSQNAEAADTINNWIEEQTKDKIKDLLSPSDLSELTKLVLTNAIYFKGLWKIQFNPEYTYKTDFELSNEETATVNMMKSDSDNCDYNYADTDDLQILELQYKGNDLSMLIILPKENNISIAESAINADSLSEWNDDLTEQEVNVQLPKFKFETKYVLNDLLQQMGIVDAFTIGAADFSGMDGTNNLFISKVIHQAYINVNEEGTEAAAATGITMELGMSMMEEFKADHPFIFLIQHKDTGAILFMGKVMNPSS